MLLGEVAQLKGAVSPSFRGHLQIFLVAENIRIGPEGLPMPQTDVSVTLVWHASNTLVACAGGFRYADTRSQWD